MTETLSIVGGAIFDGESDELREGTVYVVDGRIAAVGPDAPIDGDAVLDARGMTVLPGLIDAHFHAYAIEMDNLANESRPLSYIALAAARRLDRALRRGFTTVRDPAGGDAGLARAIVEGLVVSPRYLWTGPGMSQTGGPADVRDADSDLCVCSRHTVEIVDGVDALRRAVRDRFRRGAHAIKLMVSGAVLSPNSSVRFAQYSAEEIRAVTSEAMRHGSYVAAHAYSPAAIRHAVENGVRSIEHGNLLDAETAALMSTAGAFLVPTLAIFDAMDRHGAELGMPAAQLRKNQEVLAAGREAVSLARSAGVRVGFGTDLMGPLESEQLVGLRLQVEVDGPLLALRSATSVNAQLLGRPDLGRVAAGAVADLLLIEGNPLESPALLWSGARTVIQAGVAVGSA